MGIRYHIHFTMMAAEDKLSDIQLIAVGKVVCGFLSGLIPMNEHVIP